MPKNKLIPVINLLLILITLAAFWQVGNHGFVDYDDDTYIVQNRNIQNGITVQGLRWAFTTGYAANWHPLTWISHMLDVQIFGMSPQFHHLTNLLFHVANVLLLFFVLNRMTKAVWQSAFVAALFAFHPLHVESVAWVAERKDVLSTFFWMLTLIAYCYYAERPRAKTYLAVIAFFALGLMAKPMLVTLPFVLLLLDYWPLGRFGKTMSIQKIRTEAAYPVSASRKKGKKGKQPPKTPVTIEKPADLKFQWTLLRHLIVEKIPLFALTVLSCAATYIAQNKSGAVASVEIFTPGIRIANAFVSYLIYIGKMIWPVDLAVLYPHPGPLPLWQPLAAALFLIAITFAVTLKAKRYPYLPVGWLWYTGTLVPVIGIVQVGGQAMADRYTYIPSIGIFIMAAWYLPEILGKRRYTKHVLAGSSALCLLVLFILTWTQVGYWRDGITLFDHVLKVTNNNYFGYYCRGKIHSLLGNNARAIDDYDRAVEINPAYAPAFNNRGLAYESIGDHTRAINDYDRAVEIDPGNAEVFNNRGMVYETLGNHAKAIADFDRAIQIGSNLALAYNNRGNTRDGLGDHTGAIQDFDRAVEIDPGYAEAYNNRGITYDAMGNHVRAIEDFNRTIEISPVHAGAFYNRGRAHAFLGNQTQAMDDLKKAARLGYEDARNFLRSRGISW
jgi:protein O-mannosyl-transferase